MTLRSAAKTLLVLVLALPVAQLVLLWVRGLLNSMGDAEGGVMIGYVATVFQVVWALCFVALVIVLAFVVLNDRSQSTALRAGGATGLGVCAAMVCLQLFRSAPRLQNEVQFSATRSRCASCGYSLRGLSTNRCPECGNSFDPSDARTFRLDEPSMPSLRYALLFMPIWSILIVVIGLLKPWRGSDDGYWIAAGAVALVGGLLGFGFGERVGAMVSMATGTIVLGVGAILPSFV